MGELAGRAGGEKSVRHLGHHHACARTFALEAAAAAAAATGLSLAAGVERGGEVGVETADEVATFPMGLFRAEEAADVGLFKAATGNLLITKAIHASRSSLVSAYMITSRSGVQMLNPKPLGGIPNIPGSKRVTRPCDYIFLYRSARKGAGLTNEDEKRGRSKKNTCPRREKVPRSWGRDVR